MATLSFYALPDYADSTTLGGDKNPTQAFVQTANGTQATTATIAKAFTSNNTAGNLLFATARVSSTLTAGTLTCADSNGAWTNLPAITLASGVVIRSFYKLNCLGGANTVTITNTGGTGTQTLDLTIGEWYGANTFDQHHDLAATTTSTPSSGAVTTSRKCLAIGYAGINTTAQTFTNAASTAFTVRTVNTEVVSLASLENQAATTSTFIATYGGGAVAASAGLATFYMAGPNIQGVLLTGESSGVITVGQHRIIHIASSVSPAASTRTAISFSLGLSTGTTAATPVATSPFFLGDEGWTIDTGLYDQINLANLATYNGSSTITYSVSILSKF